MVFVEFGIAALLVVVAGSFLARHGDALAERTGLGGAWIGFALLAVITSLPELATGLSAIAAVGEPDLVFGNTLGANALNLLQVAVMSVFLGRMSVLAKVGTRAMLSAAMSLIAMGIIAAALAIGQAERGLAAARPWLWTAGPAIVLFYLFAMRHIFRDERDVQAAAIEHATMPHVKVGIRREVIGVAVSAVVIISAGYWLSTIADRLAEYPLRIGGQTILLGRSFVGVLLLSIVTTLPEMTVSVASVRIGAYSMAVGNLLGSNIFNMSILGYAEGLNWLVRGRSIFLGAAPDRPLNPIHLVMAIVGILMTGLMMVGLSSRHTRRRFILGWEEALMAVLYFGGLYLVFLGSRLTGG